MILNLLVFNKIYLLINHFNMSNTIEQQIKDVQDFFNGYAADFDSIYGHSRRRSAFEQFVDKHFRKSMRLRMEYVLSYTQNPEIKSVIDIGCGPGHYVVGFLNQGKKVVGLDIAEGMLKIAEQQISQSKLSNKDVEFVKSDYLKYKPTTNCDAACMMGFMEYIPNPVDLLKKLKMEINKEIYISFPKKGGFMAWQRKIRYNMRNCPLFMYTKSEIETLMKDSGFAPSQIEVRDCSRDYFVRIKLG